MQSLNVLINMADKCMVAVPRIFDSGHYIDLLIWAGTRLRESVYMYVRVLVLAGIYSVAVTLTISFTLFSPKKPPP